MNLHNNPSSFGQNLKNNVNSPRLLRPLSPSSLHLHLPLAPLGLRGPTLPPTHQVRPRPSTQNCSRESSVVSSTP